MIRRSSSVGPCKYLHSYDKKFMLNFCKRKKGEKSVLRVSKKKLVAPQKKHFFFDGGCGGSFDKKPCQYDDNCNNNQYFSDHKNKT